MLAAAFAGEEFGGIAADQLVERCLLAVHRPQDPAQPLDVLADAAGAGDDDPDAGFRHIDAFVQHLAGHQDPVLAGAEPVEKLLSLRSLGVVGDHRQEKGAPDRVGGVIVGGEDDDPFAGVALKQLPDEPLLAAAGPGNPLLLEIGAEGLAATRLAGAGDDELDPAVRILQRQLLGAQEIGVNLPVLPVGGLFIGIERKFDAVDIVGGEHGPLQLADVDPVDLRPHQLVQHLFAAIGPFRRCRQAQPEGGDRHPGRLLVDRSGQMMAFVKDDQAKLVADLLHLQHGRIVGRDRDVADLLLAAAKHADLAAKALFKLRSPLVDQVDRRRQDQGRPLRRLDRQPRHIGFARSGRHHHHAAPACRQPVPHGMRLVCPRLEFLDLLPGDRAKGLCLVLDLHAGMPQRQDNRGIIQRRRAVAVDPFIVGQPLAHRRKLVVRAGHQQGAGIEFKKNHETSIFQGCKKPPVV